MPSPSSTTSSTRRWSRTCRSGASSSDVTRGPTLDLGCGSGRLFGALLDGGARPLIAIDGSRALLARARARIASDDRLRRALGEGRLAVRHGDVRRPPIALGDLQQGASLVAVAGVVPHLGGMSDLELMLAALGRLLAADGAVVVDDLGPSQLPAPKPAAQRRLEPGAGRRSDRATLPARALGRARRAARRVCHAHGAPAARWYDRVASCELPALVSIGRVDRAGSRHRGPRRRHHLGFVRARLV